MTFTIGQRVRIVAPGNLNGCQGTVYDIQRAATWFDRLLGGKPWAWAQNAIAAGVHPKETAYLLDVDGLGKHGGWPGVFGFPSYWLRPLEDPKADAFLERMRKLKPYDEPKADVQRRFIEKIESVVGPLGPRFK